MLEFASVVFSVEYPVDDVFIAMIWLSMYAFNDVFVFVSVVAVMKVLGLDAK
jgi:hypothetical protein